MHRIQARIIRSLSEKDGPWAVGLEMFPVTRQEVLTKWSLGILEEEEFVREARWYETWNFNFGFYRDVFSVIKEKGIPLYALNVPRPWISKIRMKGWEALSEEERRFVPQPDLSHEEHRKLIRTIFENTEMPHGMKGEGLDMVFKGLYRAQSAWDETMAYHAVNAARREKARMIVLAGSGHLLYNLGISRRVLARNPSPSKTLVCVVIPEGKKSLQVSRSLADYVWGLPEEPRPAYPSVGLRFKKFDGLENLVIERAPIDGVAKSAGFEKGDVILSVDGKAFSDVNDLRMYLARFGWGDTVEFRILRDAQEMTISLPFELPKEDSEKTP